MACKEHPANTLWPFRAFTLTKMNILMAFMDDVNYWLLDEIFITFSTQKGQIQRRRDFSKFYGKVYRRHISMIPIWSHLKKNTYVLNWDFDSIADIYFYSFLSWKNTTKVFFSHQKVSAENNYFPYPDCNGTGQPVSLLTVVHYSKGL